jgi:hypothetical protein
MVMSKATAAMLLLKNSLPSAHSPRPQGSTTHWPAIQEDEHKENDESAAEVKEPAEDQ